MKLRLQEQPFQVLSVLLENPDRVVTREELRQGLWPADTFVDFDNGLNTAINKIREALGDSAESPRFIETVPRRGYRFIAPTQAAAAMETRLPPARLRSARNGIAWLSVAVVLLLTAAGGYLYFYRAPKLTEKDAIILADFTNSTGDPVFDGALRQGLSVQLEQTPFLRVISGDQITQTLKMMEQPVDARLTPELAREVCQRTNATVEIEGSIAALGNQYILGLNAVNCATGETFAGEQVPADGKEKVLSALNDAASELRSELGESRASLESYDAPLDQATTSSLEALQAYSQGRQAFSKSDFPSAISSLQRAVDLDPNFAMAYFSLGASYATIEDGGPELKNIKRAYDLRNRPSEYERITISAVYEFFVTRDFEKAVQLYEQLAKTYPRDPHGLGFTCCWCLSIRPVRPSGRRAARGVRLDPGSILLNLKGSAARTCIKIASKRRANHSAGSFSENRAVGCFLGFVHPGFLQNDQAGMTEQLSHPWTDQPAGHLGTNSSWDRRLLRSPN